MKLGIFDSGIGGLTVVKELLNINPNVEIIYFADTAHMPYGNKSQKCVQKYIKTIVNFLKSQQVNHIIAACGTASSILARVNLQEDIIGVIKPSCLFASKITQNGKIGIMATSLTIKMGEYQKELLQLNKKFQIFSSPCPDLASMIEQHAKDDELIGNLDKYIQPLIKNEVDTIILGCTHYPVIKKILNKMSKNVKIVDPGLETAKFVFQNYYNFDAKNDGKIKIYVSKLKDNFLQNASKILECDISKKTQQISLEFE